MTALVAYAVLSHLTLGERVCDPGDTVELEPDLAVTLLADGVVAALDGAAGPAPEAADLKTQIDNLGAAAGIAGAQIAQFIEMTDAERRGALAFCLPEGADPDSLIAALARAETVTVTDIHWWIRELSDEERGHLREVAGRDTLPPVMTPAGEIAAVLPDCSPGDFGRDGRIKVSALERLTGRDWSAEQRSVGWDALPAVAAAMARHFPAPDTGEAGGR